MRKWKNVLISAWKRCFGQTEALWWKSLKSGGTMRKWQKCAYLGLKTLFCTNSCALLKTLRSGVPRVKMTKHADLGMKTLFCTISCTLLKIENKWCAQWENDKTCWSRANNAGLLFGQTRALCWKELISGAPSAKMITRADLGLKKNCLGQTEILTLLKRVKKWCTQCKYDSTCCSPAENAVLYKLVHFAEKCKKVAPPVRKWKNVLIFGRKPFFVQCRALCWKSLKVVPRWENIKTSWSATENAVSHKLVHFA